MLLNLVIGLIIFLLYRFGGDSARTKSLPALFTIIGVLGTFAGIALGLSEFDVDNIEESVVILLDGLKFAFTTSVLGIFFAIVLRIVNLFKAPADDSTDESDMDTTAKAED